MIWDQHATPGGIFSLFVCIAGGMVYQQSPMKGEKQIVVSPAADDEAFEEEISEDGEEVSLIEKGSTPATKRRLVS